MKLSHMVHRLNLLSLLSLVKEEFNVYVFHTQGSSTLLVYFVFISTEGILFSRLILF
jgi:hypothetical protein